MDAFLLLNDRQAQEARDAMPHEEENREIAELFKLLGEESRLRILSLLLCGPMCVGDIAGLLSMSDSAVSHQLRILKQGRLVRSHREGKAMVYTLADGHVQTLLQNAREHISE